MATQPWGVQHRLTTGQLSCSTVAWTTALHRAQPLGVPLTAACTSRPWSGGSQRLVVSSGSGGPRCRTSASVRTCQQKCRHGRAGRRAGASAVEHCVDDH